MEITIQLGKFVKATLVAELVERVIANNVEITHLDDNMVELTCGDNTRVDDNHVVVILDLLGLYKPTTIVVGDKLYTLCFEGKKPVRKKKLMILDKNQNVEVKNRPVIDYSILTESKNPYNELKDNGLYVTSSIKVDYRFMYGIDTLDSGKSVLEDVMFHYITNSERKINVYCDVDGHGPVII